MSTALGRLALLALAAPGACSIRPPGPDITFSDLAGGRHKLADLAGHSAVLVFWRSDCGPCTIELNEVKDLEAAAGPAPLLTVALQDGPSAGAFLQSLGERPKMAWVAPGDAAKTLVAFSGPPPRLPLAVAIDSRGDICQRHIGLLGTDRVTQWVRQCS